MRKPKHINFIYNTSGVFIITVHIVSGSIYETLFNKGERSVCGISHFLEHLLFKNTEKYTGKELLEAFTQLGGNYNASTDKDQTMYYVKTVVNNFVLATDIIYDIVCRPILEGKDLEDEKRVVLEELARAQDSQDDFIYEESTKTLLKNDNPYILPVIGNKKDLKSITLADVKRYYKERFDPSKMMVIVNCDISFKDVISNYIHKKFSGALGPLITKSFNGTEPEFMISSQSLKTQNVVLSYSDSYQYTTCILFPSFTYSCRKNNVILDFIRFCLTESGLYSILYYELREKRGLVYNVKLTTDSNRYLGITRLTFATSNKDTLSILKVIFEALDDLKRYGLDKKSLKHFKTSCINHYAYKLSNEEYRTSWYGDNMFYGSMLSEKGLLDSIAKITNDDIKKIASAVFDMKKVVVYSNGKYDKNEGKEHQITNSILSLLYSYAN